ncbi:MAG: sugar phosphate isomerase/epimerase [Bacteroidales bacterium]|jgi:sugar phosphate isomerase/epimerase|nr:sugar phosphate isomerase/epimerase [Bacteroidales bacterium]
MKNNGEMKNGISRRKFLGTSAAAAALAVIPVAYGCKTRAAADEVPAVSDKPNSKFGGVQIGAITYSWRSMPSGIENVIKYCKEAGINSIELMSTDLEQYLGIPENPMRSMFGGGGQRQAPPPPPPPPPAGTRPAAQAAPAQAQRPAGGQRPPLTEEQQAAVAKYNEDVKNFRINVDMAKVAAAKKLFDDEGIGIHIVKFSPARWSDEEIDYAFKVAKAMGAKGVCDEISEEAVNKMGPIAEKHGMYAVFHNHMQFATEGFSYDPFLAVSPAVMMNFDTGHFFGSTGIHPNTIIEKYHDRLFSIHMKDKTGPNADPPNTNQVWGQGEAPIADVLLLLKKNQWPIYVDIELEYEVKPWSNAVKETRTCVQYARNILI